MKALSMAIALACTALPLSLPVLAQAPVAKAPAAAAQSTFASPEAAAKALADAVRAADVQALLKVVGPSSRSFRLWLIPRFFTAPASSPMPSSESADRIDRLSAKRRSTRRA